MTARRLVSAAFAAVVAIATLSACQVKTGAAAFVGKTEISQTEVGHYVQSTTSTTTTSNAKSIIVQTLISVDLFQAALAGRKGGVPSDAKIATGHDAIISNLLSQITGNQVSVTGAKADTELRAALKSLSLGPRFDALIVREQALESILASEVSAQTIQDLAKAVNKVGLKVSVNPRYGAWDPNTLNLTAGPAVPSYVKTVTSPSASPSSAG